MLKFKKLFWGCMCVCIVFCLILYYPEIKPEIIASLKIWCNVLVPSIFPYMVLSQYAVGAGYLKALSKVLFRVMHPVLKVGKDGTEVYICSLVCGYPSGAICANDLYTSGKISKSEAMRIICLTSNAGPLFLISAIGSDMLSNTADGIALYVIQCVSCLIAASLTAPFFKAETTDVCNHVKREKKDLCCCIQNSVTSTVNIGGFTAAIAVICKIILLLLKNLPFAFIKNSEQFLQVLIYSVFEISKGALEITGLEPHPLTFALLCGAVSWGGICVLMQIKSVLAQNFKTGFLAKFKMMQSAIAFFAGYAYKLNFPALIFLKNSNALFYALTVSLILFAVYIVRDIANKKSGQIKKP